MPNAMETRRIDELGRIVLPMGMRKILGWEEKTELDLCSDEDKQEMVLRKHNKSCVFCGDIEELKAFGKKCICSNCQKEVVRL